MMEPMMGKQMSPDEMAKKCQNMKEKEKMGMNGGKKQA